MIGRVWRTGVLLASGRCEAFDDNGHPASISVGLWMRLKIAYRWWVW